MGSRLLRVALIGQGFMGRAHSNAWHQVAHFFCVPFHIRRRVLCGQNPERLREMAEIWQWEETSTNWREVVSRTDVDLVDIVLPNGLHEPVALAAAEAGKIVLCEKPLANSLEAAERMAAACHGTPSLVWFNYRRAPAVAFARQLIDEGRLGRPFHYRATYLQQSGLNPKPRAAWKADKEMAGSGALGDLMSHVVDMALYLNGPLREVSAMLHTFEPERPLDDAVLVLARFENGSVGTFEATRYGVGCRNQNRFEIHGSNGKLGFNLENLNVLEFTDASEAGNLQGPRNILVTGPGHPHAGRYWPAGHIIGYEHTFISALADFLDALGSGEPYHPDFADGLAVQCVLDTIERSARERRWIALP